MLGEITLMDKEMLKVFEKAIGNRHKELSRIALEHVKDMLRSHTPQLFQSHIDAITDIELGGYEAIDMYYLFMQLNIQNVRYELQFNQCGQRFTVTCMLNGFERYRWMVENPKRTHEVPEMVRKRDYEEMWGIFWIPLSGADWTDEDEKTLKMFCNWMLCADIQGDLTSIVTPAHALKNYISENKTF